MYAFPHPISTSPRRGSHQKSYALEDNSAGSSSQNHKPTETLEGKSRLPHLYTHNHNAGSPASKRSVREASPTDSTLSFIELEILINALFSKSSITLLVEELDQSDKHQTLKRIIVGNTPDLIDVSINDPTDADKITNLQDDFNKIVDELIGEHRKHHLPKFQKEIIDLLVNNRENLKNEFLSNIISPSLAKGGYTTTQQVIQDEVKDFLSTKILSYYRDMHIHSHSH